jgi:hypothetical protein
LSVKPVLVQLVRATANKGTNYLIVPGSGGDGRIAPLNWLEIPVAVCDFDKFQCVTIDVRTRQIRNLMIFFVVEDVCISVLLFGGAEGWDVIVCGDQLQEISCDGGEGIAA